MRFAVLLAAMAALFVQTAPAAAATPINGPLDFFISGTVTGFKVTFDCSTPQCTQEITPVTMYVSKTIGRWAPSAFDDGIETFAAGNRDIEYFEGTIKYLGDGQFTGLDLSYSLGRNCFSCRETYSYGWASTFSVVAVAGVVPEPATWALLLIGFGAIGWTMRRHHAPVTVSPKSPQTAPVP